nr:MAG TPA: hypothetical protein [Caudoviricetes sp.]DAO01222.1 MAG TPA: hypothetical protein [Caudoviricetes sp.]
MTLRCRGYRSRHLRPEIYIFFSLILRLPRQFFVPWQFGGWEIYERVNHV